MFVSFIHSNETANEKKAKLHFTIIAIMDIDPTQSLDFIRSDERYAFNNLMATSELLVDCEE